MFARLILRLMGLEQKPPEPFQGEVGGLANSATGFDAEVWEAIRSIRELDILWGEGRKLATVPCVRF